MGRVLLLHKPYGVLCQFTDRAGRATLADFVPVPGVYAAGRLDTDSEGLVVLTDDGRLQARIADPAHVLEKVYWVQVDGALGDAARARLRAGVEIAGGRTRPARGSGSPRTCSPLGQRDHSHLQSAQVAGGNFGFDCVTNVAV